VLLKKCGFGQQVNAGALPPAGAAATVRAVGAEPVVVQAVEAKPAAVPTVEAVTDMVTAPPQALTKKDASSSPVESDNAHSHRFFKWPPPSNSVEGEENQDKQSAKDTPVKRLQEDANGENSKRQKL
jgi:hypothetical protein